MKVLDSYQKSIEEYRGEKENVKWIFNSHDVCEFVGGLWKCGTEHNNR